MANAENNFNLVKENLFIKEFKVDEGVKMRRFKAKGFGRAGLIQKKTSHVTIILSERVPGMKRAESKKSDEVHEHKHKEEKVAKIKDIEKRPEAKKEIGQKKAGFVKRMFQRKSI